jgi:PhnB protein
LAGKKKASSKATAAGAKRTNAKKKVSPIPKGYRTMTPYLMVKGAAQAIEFYKVAFGAKELMRMPGPNGTIGHAELQFGDCVVMLSDEAPGMGYVGPLSLGGTPVGLHLYLKDVDGVVARAVAGGAKLTRPIENKFYGDRSGTLEDPFGHRWTVSTHVEDVPPKEMELRAAAQPQG